jgi:hypothetical protein
MSGANNFTERLRALIEEGLCFSDCVRAFAAEEEDPYVVAARRIHGDEGSVEIDDRAVLSDSCEGNYVSAWVWVSDEDAGVSSDDEDDEHDDSDA